MRTPWIPALVLAAACSSDSSTPSALAPDLSVSAASAVGQVYTMDNQVGANAVLVFDRGVDGALTPAGSIATGGTGTGGGLGNQGAVILAGNGRYLLAVNAGSNDVTSFLVRPNGSLERVGRWPSGGMGPVSVTEHQGIVYVLNAGGTGNITGFRFVAGRLSMLPGSSQSLSSPAAGAAQVQFARNGRVLLVTEKGTNAISSYTVDNNGNAAGPTVIASNGQTPFGFGVRGSVMIVSEAFGGAPDASALSSYEIGTTGALRVLSPSVGTTETAACWVVITNDGRFAYTSNTGSATISGYGIQGGHLSLLDSDGVTTTTDAGPIDLALTMNSRYLYSLNAASNTIQGFAVGPNGELTLAPGAAAGLPVGTNGLAAR